MGFRGWGTGAIRCPHNPTPITYHLPPALRDSAICARMLLIGEVDVVSIDLQESGAHVQCPRPTSANSLTSWTSFAISLAKLSPDVSIQCTGATTRSPACLTDSR